MRFLLDENLSPRLVSLLSGEGHDVVHVRDVGLRSSPDDEVLEFARSAARVLVSSDTDFGELLAVTNADSPSLLLLRRQTERPAAEIAQLIVANLAAVAEDIAAGSVVVLDADRIRIRRLPFRPV